MEALQDSIFDEVRVMELEDSCDIDADIDLTLLEVLEKDPDNYRLLVRVD